MKKMSGTELKVVMLVTRKTLGWFYPMTSERKVQDYISQSQFMDFTGQSNRAIATAIQVCVERGWIVARDSEGKLCNSPELRARRKIWYQLGTVFTDKISSEESSSDLESSGEQNDMNLVKKVHSTKETITKERLQDFPSENALSLDDGEIRIVPDGEEQRVARVKADPRVREIAEKYMKHKGLTFKTKAHMTRDLARNMKAAKKLLEFSGGEILKGFQFCEEKFGDMWTLETVANQMSSINKKS